MNKKIIIAAVLVGLLIASFFLYRARVKNDTTVPPYYQTEVFQKPAGLAEEPVASLEARIKLPIIMYHYVEYVQDVNDLIRKKLDTNPYLFEMQLKTLKENNYELYFVRDIPDILDGKIKISTRSAVLTFDDGYQDFYSVAFPLLKKYHAKATIYVVYNFIGRRGFLTANNIKEILASGLVELGSHTLDHMYLKKINPQVAKKQIEENKIKLEQDFGVEVKTFAFPYGAFDNQALDFVKQASYSAAVSVIPGIYQSKENLFFLYRLRSGVLGTGKYMLRVLEKYSK